MNKAAFVTWVLLRIARWISWASFLAYCFAIPLDRQSYLNSYGNPLPSTEAWLFGLPVAAVAAGLFELMMRERAGIRSSRYPAGRRS
ncbi:hypothetical protein [Bradyrhizobium sp. WSM1743]|uniref:hypothetical protein n=1 Tax=Bradyrhizobium sp. WSM1743 TaxID=318996 RepID=UPI0012EB81DF|nr:hypothetical protein [Bradyrhizobium sp. WSM1743]